MAWMKKRAAARRVEPRPISAAEGPVAAAAAFAAPSFPLTPFAPCPPLFPGDDTSTISTSLASATPSAPFAFPSSSGGRAGSSAETVPSTSQPPGGEAAAPFSFPVAASRLGPPRCGAPTASESRLLVACGRSDLSTSAGSSPFIASSAGVPASTMRPSSIR
eukprot:scaffold4435_cov88-Isochrysis_galbana.AAC.1